jgi:hypothetical protein
MAAKWLHPGGRGPSEEPVAVEAHEPPSDEFSGAFTVEAVDE